ncbi:hypothetical protein [Hyphomonas sp.]|uniref:hypothetical protein n=1 Tax=Hyphomonas sp. TaxID=87 RepID=UPI0025BEF827|nr:hypothetical protein [Hyphomonas sp.]
MKTIVSLIFVLAPTHVMAQPPVSQEETYAEVGRRLEQIQRELLGSEAGAGFLVEGKAHAEPGTVGEGRGPATGSGPEEKNGRSAQASADLHVDYSIRNAMKIASETAKWLNGNPYLRISGFTVEIGFPPSATFQFEVPPPQPIAATAP